MRKINLLLLSLTLFVGVISCKKSEDTKIDSNFPPYNPTYIDIQIPKNLPNMVIPPDNPTTVEGVRLGRMLYYDKLLHPTGKQACATCHLQSSGFTTPGTNIIPHINLGYGSKFLWDGSKQGNLEKAMLFEVEIFFGTDVSRLQNDSKYPLLFHQAFGSSIIDSQKCAYALAQFLRTLISGNSKFDRYMRREATLTPSEMQGLILFNTEKGDCFHCHSVPLTTDSDLHNIGLDSIFNETNAGYYNISHNSADLGKYKSPSLRNAGLRTSFMHDGRFKTLEEVIEHYNSKVKLSPSLDPIMTKPGKEFGLQLSPTEKQNLKDFLLTLTDSTVLTDPNFSSPF